VATATARIAGASTVIGPASTLATSTVDEAGARPVYAPFVDAAASDAAAPLPYRIHVLQNGDTLERLAERYLGDGSRALELFDLNRDVLDNPHLLTLGAELRIPMPPAVDQE
jgi:nucleoid-associated protein YgaU